MQVEFFRPVGWTPTGEGKEAIARPYKYPSILSENVVISAGGAATRAALKWVANHFITCWPKWCRGRLSVRASQ